MKTPEAELEQTTPEGSSRSTGWRGQGMVPPQESRGGAMKRKADEDIRSRRQEEDEEEQEEGEVHVVREEKEEKAMPEWFEYSTADFC